MRPMIQECFKMNLGGRGRGEEEVGGWVFAFLRDAAIACRMDGWYGMVWDTIWYHTIPYHTLNPKPYTEIYQFNVTYQESMLENAVLPPPNMGIFKMPSLSSWQKTSWFVGAMFLNGVHFFVVTCNTCKKCKRSLGQSWCNIWDTTCWQEIEQLHQELCNLKIKEGILVQTHLDNGVF